LLEAMGEQIVHVGPVGHGQMAKLLTNTMGAVNAAVLAEAVRTAKAAGLDRDAFLEVAGASAGASAMLTLKGPPMFEERFEPALFKLEHMLKDVRHCLDEARALGIELRLGALAETLFARADQAGHGEQDFAAVYTAL
jgi:3-hydroxyisobutyrate dehydrogenase-like beta-hydroxyacid dehydrogenase